jgi:large subunit ribosomal protein L25
MKTIEIIGHKRANLGKRGSKTLRLDAKVPGVMYGGKEQVHFYTYMSLLKDLVYVADAQFVNLNIEGTEYKCILQEIQFHPVSDMIMHIDMLQVFDDKKITVDVPVITSGNSPGVAMGGLLSIKVRKLPVRAYPKDMPESLQVDLSKLNLKDIVTVKDLKVDSQFEILKVDGFPIVSVDLSRALKSAASKEGKS